MLHKTSVKDFIISLVVLVLLSFVAAPMITSLVVNTLPYSINWQNSGLMDPNGAPPFAIFTLIGYIIAGMLMSKLVKSNAVGYTFAASALYAVFQIWNFGGFSTYYRPFTGHILVFLAIVSLTTLGAYIGRQFLFK